MKKNQQKIIALLAILLFFYVALDSMVDDSPTFDEHYYITSGLTFLRTGDPRLNYFHPPLVNGIIAAPLLTMPQIKLPLDVPAWDVASDRFSLSGVADRLVWEKNRDLNLGVLFFLARMPVLFFTLGLALAGWHFGRLMWGHLAPLIVFLLLLFDPNLLAHGRYATTDLIGTFFGFLALMTAWSLFNQQSFNQRRTLGLGLALGLAFSSKYTNLTLLPLLGILACLPLYRASPSFSLRNNCKVIARCLVQLAVATTIGFFVLWATYGFQWRSFFFPSPRISFLNAFSGPMPTYFYGLVRHLGMSSRGFPAFLMGQISENGFPLYFPFAFLVKTPLLSITLLILSAIVLVRLKETRRQALFLFISFIILFLLYSRTRINIGYRHLLLLLAVAYLLIGGLGGEQIKRWWAQFSGKGKLGRAALPGTILLFLTAVIILGTLRIHPYYLTYFNYLAGGPQGGYRVLADSNIDWGQDLIRLKKWMEANDIDSIKLSWFGSSYPDYYGIAYEPLPGFSRHFNLWMDPPFNPDHPEPGIYAISVTNLWGPYTADPQLYRWFQVREPDQRIGNSIHIYEVP